MSVGSTFSVFESGGSSGWSGEARCLATRSFHSACARGRSVNDSGKHSRPSSAAMISLPNEPARTTLTLARIFGGTTARSAVNNPRAAKFNPPTKRRFSRQGKQLLHILKGGLPTW